MIESGRKVRFASIAFVLALGVAAIPALGRVTEEFHHTYPLNTDGRVSLENVNGNVHISAWGRNEVKVDAIKFAPDSDRLADITIEIDAHADSIYIKTRYPHHLFNNNPGGVEYTLTVPQGARLDKIDLVNGSLDIDGVTGDLKGSLVNGSVKAHATRGGTELSTVNGRVELTVDDANLKKPISLSSVNGGLVLNLPADVNARLNASSVTGGINSDFQIAVHGWFVGHSLEGQLGSGGPEIHLSDVNGRISIRRSSQVTN